MLEIVNTLMIQLLMGLAAVEDLLILVRVGNKKKGRFGGLCDMSQLSLFETPQFLRKKDIRDCNDIC